MSDDDLFEARSFKSDSDCDSFDQAAHTNGLHVGFPTKSVDQDTRSTLSKQSDDQDKISYLPAQPTRIDEGHQTSETRSNSDDDMEQASVQGSVYSKYSKASFTSRLSKRRQKPWEPQFNLKSSSVSHLGHHNHPWESTSVNSRQSSRQISQPQFDYNDRNHVKSNQYTFTQRKQGQEVHSGDGFSFSQKDIHRGLAKKHEEKPVAVPTALSIVGSLFGYATDLSQSDDDTVSVLQMYRGSQSDDDMETASKAATVSTIRQMFRLDEEEIEDTMEDRNIKEGIELSRKTHVNKVKTTYDIDGPLPRTLAKHPSIKNGLCFTKAQNWKQAKPGQELVESSEDENLSHPFLDPLDELLHPEMISMRNSQVSLDSLTKEEFEASGAIDPNHQSKNINDGSAKFLDPEKAMEDLEELSVAEQVIAEFENIDVDKQNQDIDYYRHLAGIDDESLPSLETATMSVESWSDTDDKEEALRTFVQGWLQKMEEARFSQERTLLDMFRWTQRQDIDQQERVRFLGQSLNKSVREMVDMEASQRLEFEMSTDKEKQQNGNVAETEFIWPEYLRVQIEPMNKEERKGGRNMKQRAERDFEKMFRKTKLSRKEDAQRKEAVQKEAAAATAVAATASMDASMTESSSDGTEFLFYEAGIGTDAESDEYEVRLSESSSLDDEVPTRHQQINPQGYVDDTDASSEYLFYDAGVDSESDTDSYHHRFSESSTSDGTPSEEKQRLGSFDSELLTSPKSPSEELNNEALNQKTRSTGKPKKSKRRKLSGQNSESTSEYLYFESGLDSSSQDLEYKLRVSESSSAEVPAREKKPPKAKSSAKQESAGTSHNLISKPPVEYVTTDEEWVDDSVHTATDTTEHLYFELGLDDSVSGGKHTERLSDDEEDDGHWEFLGLRPPPEAPVAVLAEEEKTEEVSPIANAVVKDTPLVAANRKPPKSSSKVKARKKAKERSKKGIKPSASASVAERGYSNGSLHLYYSVGLISDSEADAPKKSDDKRKDKRKKRSKAQKKKTTTCNGSDGANEKAVLDGTTRKKQAIKPKKQKVDNMVPLPKEPQNKTKLSDEKRKKKESRSRSRSKLAKATTSPSSLDQTKESDLQSESKRKKLSSKGSKNSRRAKRASLVSKSKGRSETDDEDSIVVTPPVFRKAPSRATPEKQDAGSKAEVSKKAKKTKTKKGARKRSKEST